MLRVLLFKIDAVLIYSFFDKHKQLKVLGVQNVKIKSSKIEVMRLMKPKIQSKSHKNVCCCRWFLTTIV